jgi:hypothetical protein
MSYQAFLLVMSQLAGQKKARVVVQDHVIFFETSAKKNYLKLYTEIFNGEGYLPRSIRSCLSSYGTLRWQCDEAYIKLDPMTSSIYLIDEVELEHGKFLPFRDLLSEFSSAASEWKGILQELADRDYFSVSVS